MGKGASGNAAPTSSQHGGNKRRQRQAQKRPRMGGRPGKIDIFFDGRTNVGIHVRAHARTEIGPYVTGHVRLHCKGKCQNTWQQGKTRTSGHIPEHFAALMDEASEHKPDLMPEQASEHFNTPQVRLCQACLSIHVLCLLQNRLLGNIRDLSVWL